MPTSYGKFVVLSTQIVLGLLVNVLLLGWAGGMCEEPACVQLAASFSYCTGCGKYSHHLSIPHLCEGLLSSQSGANSGADEFGLVELLAVSVISKICRKFEDQGEVETKYMPLRILSCTAGCPVLHFSPEVLSVQPLLVSLFILTPK